MGRVVVTASKSTKQVGLKNLSEVSELTGVSHQTLNNWYHNKPMLFATVIAGCVQTIRPIRDGVLEVMNK